MADNLQKVAKDYDEILCTAIATIAEEKIKGIKFDETILCEIIDNASAKDYKYRVTDGSTKFYAYSQVTNYAVGDKVYVTVPQGDFNQEKIITGKKVSDDTTPFVFTSPLASMLNITGNLCDDIEEGLLANAYYDQLPIEDTTIIEKYISQPIWTLDNISLTGYDRVGLCADFLTILKDIGVVKGDYGLLLRFDSNEDITTANNETKKKVLVFKLSTSDMYGDPYNYATYYTQEQVFDISSITTITKMSLFFYQEPGSFFDKDGNPIPYEEEIIPGMTTGNLLDNNIFVKGIQVFLGYDLATFVKEKLILFSSDNSTYKSTTDSASIKKTIYLRWVHQQEDGTTIQVNQDQQLEEDYTVNWYQYEFGAASADQYAGVYWNKLENGTKSLSYSFVPNGNKDIEKIKVIVLYGSGDNITPYYSNILSFTNEHQVANDATIDTTQALKINCDDGSNGNYYLYELGGALQNDNDKDVERTMYATFDPTANPQVDKAGNVTTALVEANEICWKIPVKNTMISVDKSFYDDADSAVNDGTWLTIIRKDITQTDDAINSKVKQKYRIKNHYQATANNNTVECYIIRHKDLKYTTTKIFNFGEKGTAGTPNTLVANLQNGINALTAGDSGAKFVFFHLYNSENEEIDLQAFAEEFENASQTPPMSAAWYTGNSNLIKLEYPITIDGKKYWDRALLSLQIAVSQLGYKSGQLYENYNILSFTIEGYDSGLNGANGTTRAYDLTTYLPIPIRVTTAYEYLNGPTYVRYDSSGKPNYYTHPYELENAYGDKIDVNFERQFKVNTDINEDNADIYYPVLTGNNLLQPLQFYMEDSSKNVCVVAYKYNADGTKKPLWLQPILIYQNDYPCEMLNSWDGKTLTIDEDNGEILATAIAAGKKTADNKFTGVILGDVKRNAERVLSEHTGVYGYHEGKMAYALIDDGTAFLGEEGRGRINFNGNKGEIYSSAWEANKQGMHLDLDDGSIEMNQTQSRSYAVISPLGYTKEGTTDESGTDADGNPITSTGTVTVTPANHYTELQTAKTIYIYREYELLSSDPDAGKDTKTTCLYKPVTFKKHDLTASSYVQNRYYYDSTTDSDTATYILATEAAANFVTRQYYEPTSFEQIYRSEFTTFPANTYYRKVDSDERYVAVGSLPYDENITYYGIDGLSTAHYVTLAADEKNYPLAIGTDSSLSKRNFRVKWDGTMYATNGHFTGTIDLKSDKKYITLTTDDTVNSTTPFSIGSCASISSRKFRVDWDGTMHAVNGDFTGTISIDKGNRHITLTTLDTVSTYPLSIGTTTDAASRAFRVDWSGKLWATGGDFSGKIVSTEGQIGGWVIGTDSLHTTNKTAYGSGDGAYLGADGTLDFTHGSSYLRYSAKGNLSVHNGDIDGGTISIGDGPFFYADSDQIDLGDWHIDSGNRSSFYYGDWDTSQIGISNTGTAHAYRLWVGWNTSTSYPDFGVTGGGTSAATLECSISADNQHGIYARFA